MYSKIAVFSALVAICSAGVILDDGHSQGHGHAVSSQSIVRHDQPSHHESHYNGLNDGHYNGLNDGHYNSHNDGHYNSHNDGHYATPNQHTVYQHAAPIAQHTVYQHSAPAIIGQNSHVQHYEHSAPLFTAVHAAPVVHQATPIVHYNAPVASIAVGHGHQEQIEEHGPAKYEYAYSVEDPHSGDHKSHHETREGDVVEGEYSLLQPDGSVRKVTYTADHHNGFNAIVHNSAPTVHAETAPAHHDAHNAYHH